MEAIVLAGGFGTRLRELVPDLPKPMAPIAGRPFLEILLCDLAVKGFDHVILSLGYKAEAISSYFGTHYAGLRIDSVVETEPLGTGGGVRLACELAKADHLYIFNGDTYLDLEAAAVEALWQRSQNPVIVARSVTDTTRYGRLLVDEGRVIGFTEKGVSGPGLINAGCCVLSRVQLNALPPAVPFSLEQDFLAPLVQRSPVEAFVTEGDFIDIGIPEDFHRAQTLLAGRHQTPC
jgi:D-glycero-alpha-D-manno-heptose 1-phosphate guanylyltransferase